MATWQTDNPITWYSSLVGSLWNDLQILWNDPVANWDATGVQDWYDDNEPDWFNQN